MTIQTSIATLTALQSALTDALAALQAAAPSPAPAPTPAPSPAPAPAPSTNVVYGSGKFNWAGDWSFAGTPNYAPPNLTFTVTGAWGCWLPYAPNETFNTAGLTHITLVLQPTQANQKWSLSFYTAGDVLIQPGIDISAYGPAPVVGQWGTYIIPLTAVGVTGQPIMKFGLQDQTGLASNVWYVQTAAFS